MATQILNELHDLIERVQKETLNDGKQCQYCKHFFGTASCRGLDNPEVCPEVERQLRATLFHLDATLNVREPKHNDWLKLSEGV